MFAWSALDMPIIDPKFYCHKLAIYPEARYVAQRKRKLNPERGEVVDEESRKLLNVGFIREVQYATWLANMVMLRKPNGIWRMCTNYTDLNKAYPKDSYLLSSIDHLVGGAFEFLILSFSVSVFWIQSNRDVQTR